MLLIEVRFVRWCILRHAKVQRQMKPQELEVQEEVPEEVEIHAPSQRMAPHVPRAKLSAVSKARGPIRHIHMSPDMSVSPLNFTGNLQGGTPTTLGQQFERIGSTFFIRQHGTHVVAGTQKYAAMKPDIATGSLKSKKRSPRLELVICS